MKNKLITIISVLVLIVLSSCSIFSDPETEKKFVGTWESSWKDREDGVTMEFRETVIYKDDNTFKSKLNLTMTSPMYMPIVTVTYNGEWNATSSKLIGEIDKSSVEFKFSSSAKEMGISGEMKSEFLSGLKESDYIDGGKILEITEDLFKLEDEEDGAIYKYTRLN